jgi:acid-sensing ion channel, other
VLLNADIENYSITNGKFDGFKVKVHSPDEFPNVADTGFVIGPGFETFVAVKVTTVYNTDDVGIKVPLTKRKCHVEGQFMSIPFFNNLIIRNLLGKPEILLKLKKS